MNAVPPLTVVQVVARLHAAGSETVAVALACGLARRGHESWVVALTRADEDREVRTEMLRRLAAASVHVVEFPGRRYGPAAVVGAARLVALHARVRPDVVHSHTDRPDFAVALASRVRRMRVVRTVHNTVLWGTRPRVGRFVESAFCDDLVVCVSEGSRRAYTALRLSAQLPPSPHVLSIGNGVPRQAGAPVGRADVVARCGADAQRLLLCFGGRLTHQKGFDVLLAALEHLPPQIREHLEVHAFGAGEEGAAYAVRVAASELPVRMHEPVPGLGDIVAGFDAVVMPSRYEGLPMVALEAFSAGVPVLASTAPGLVEALPPEWPLTVAPDDPRAFAGLLADAVDGRWDLPGLGRAAAVWVHDRFDVDDMVTSYEAAYADHCGAGRPARDPATSDGVQRWSRT